MFDRKSILITGGAGSFGRQHIETLLTRHQPKHYDSLLGRKVNQGVRKGTPMRWNLVG